MARVIVLESDYQLADSNLLSNSAASADPKSTLQARLHLVATILELLTASVFFLTEVRFPFFIRFFWCRSNDPKDKSGRFK